MKNTRRLNNRILELTKSGLRVSQMARLEDMPTVDEICNIIANDSFGVFAQMEITEKNVHRRFCTDLADEVIDRVLAGESLDSISKIDYMPAVNTLKRWVVTNVEGFGDAYNYAFAMRLKFMTEEVIDIADDSRNDYIEKMDKDGGTFISFDRENVQRAKLRVDTRLKVLEKLNPDYNTTQKIDHTSSDGSMTPTDGFEIEFKNTMDDK